MSNSRRDFLRKSGLAGMSFAGSWMGSYASTDQELEHIKAGAEYTAPQIFNMSGYAAPALDVVRIGIVGIGNRGFDAVTRMNKIEGVEIKGLCDLRPERVKLANDLVTASGHKPELYHTNPEAWKTMCARKDIDLIYILTPWALHTPMALFSMHHDKHVCVEVPAGKTLQELWSLVETSEKTRKHCMMVENCCYDFFELTTLNMVRQGFFGEIVHCEGAYIHGLTDILFSKEHFYQMWELDENTLRKGNLYPTHGLGPICQVMNINRGDKMDYLVSVSTNDFTLSNEAKQLATKDDFYKPYVGRSFNGNMNTSAIRTNKGKTIMVQFDVSSPRPYSRIQLVSGTKAVALKYPEPARYATGHEWLDEEAIKILQEKYKPEIVKKIGEAAKEVGGHGGMDFIMDWRTIDCLRNGLPLDQDVYDAALWSSVSPLSVWSVANKSNSITVPDFTRGAWKTNAPVDISMSKGGTTGIK
ncbi:MAG: Gfo/Idh/MocA family oxidoreductase [Chitinophagaceae bacterium]|nr:Gfo/Idh/MocA family oxidoreductase [Chitinophagaceae bacterium]